MTNHPELEFEVRAGSEREMFPTFEDAARYAILASNKLRKAVSLDVLAYSYDAAKSFGIPWRKDASVAERVSVSAQILGPEAQGPWAVQMRSRAVRPFDPVNRRFTSAGQAFAHAIATSRSREEEVLVSSKEGPYANVIARSQGHVP